VAHAGDKLAGDSAAHWRALRDAGDIQFTPLSPPPPQPPSHWGEWLAKLFEWLAKILRPVFEPVGKALGLGWPVMRIALVVLVGLAVLALLWRWLAPVWRRWRAGRKAPVETEWQPDRQAALALLADADRLAGEGRYDEAVHVLLARSVDQIAQVRPGWLQPASTAREIAALGGLSAAARGAFATIAGRVEASRFALRALAEADWAGARAAYAEFAGQRIDRSDGAAA